MEELPFGGYYTPVKDADFWHGGNIYFIETASGTVVATEATLEDAKKGASKLIRPGNTYVITKVVGVVEP